MVLNLLNSRAPIIGVFFACSTFLFSAESSAQPLSWFRPVISLSVGEAISNVGRTQTLSVPNDFTEYHYFKGSDRYSNSALWGGFLGTKIPLGQKCALNLGVSYYQPSRFHLNDAVLTQGVDVGSSDSFGYRYHVKSYQVLAEAKLERKLGEYLYPFVSLGLGGAVNRAYNYTANAPAFLTFTPLFSDHKNKSFSYSVGIGMDIAANDHWRLGVAYRFSDFGKAHLGEGVIDTQAFPARLSQSHLYVNQVTWQLSYLLF